MIYIYMCNLLHISCLDTFHIYSGVSCGGVPCGGIPWVLKSQFPHRSGRTHTHSSNRFVIFLCSNCLLRSTGASALLSVAVAVTCPCANCFDGLTQLLSMTRRKDTYGPYGWIEGEPKCDKKCGTCLVPSSTNCWYLKMDPGESIV